MIELIYPLIKYVDSIDSNKAIMLKKLFSITENNKELEEIYNLIIDKSSNNNCYIYKLSNILDESGKSYMPYTELNFDDSFLIRDSENSNSVDYNVIQKTYWNTYIDNVYKKLIDSSKNYTKLYYTCMKYLSNIPAINADRIIDKTGKEQSNNISLFDVCKLSAALYNCRKKDKEKLILIKGDFSGIQSFIYKTKDDGALKTLKGRSLYLTILQDLCAKFIINQLNLNISNLLYSGGGNFYILASEKDKNKFEQSKKCLSQVLLNAHKGEIYLALSCTTFNQKQIDDFSTVWKESGNENGKVKNKKWSELGLQQNYTKIFGPLDNGGTLEESCNLCGAIVELENNHNCSLCNSYIKLIDYAKNKTYYTEEIIDTSGLCVKQTYKNIYDIFESIGYKIEFENQPQQSKNKIIYKINDFCLNKSDGFIFKSIRFNTNSLDDICYSLNEIGDKKIGVIKLDVDNLGKLFIQTKKIGQVIGLSERIAMFFEGYIEKSIFEKAKIQECTTNLNTCDNWNKKITIIYAGGDDTFIVGRYDEVFEFANYLHNIFIKYVVSNKKTFTAGVGMFNANMPILRTANITENMLESGKDTEGKNKIVFMGEVFTWDDFNELIEFKNKIQDIYKITQNKALFQKIANSTKGFNAIFKKGKNQVSYLKVYRLAYYLRDLHKGDLKNKKEKEIENMIDNLIEKYESLCIGHLKSDGKSKKIMIIPYANKWAQCNCRKIEKGDK